MNFFAASGLVNGLISTVCGVTVFCLNPKSRKNVTYVLYCISLSVWSYFYCAWQLSDDPSRALLFCRVLMMGAIFIPTFHYHHIVTLFDLMTPRRRLVLRVAYALTLLYFMSNFTTLFIAKVEKRSIFSYWPVPGPLFHPYLVMFMTFLGLSLTLMREVKKKASPVLANGMAWIAFATILGYGGGSTNFPLWYNIPIRPYLNVAVSFYIAINALLFFRLQLIDIQLMGRNSLVWLSSGILGILPFVFSTFVAKLFWTWPRFAFTNGPGPLICCVIILSLIPTMFTVYQNPYARRACYFFIPMAAWNSTVLFLCIPQTVFSVWVYRFGYGIGCIVILTWFSFWVKYFEGKTPSVIVTRWVTRSCWIMLPFAGLTPWVLKSLSFDPLHLKSATIVVGPAHSLFSIWFLAIVSSAGAWSISTWWKSDDIDKGMIGFWIFGSFLSGGSAAVAYFLFAQGKLNWYWYPFFEFITLLILMGALVWRMPINDRRTRGSWARQLGGFALSVLSVSVLVGFLFTQNPWIMVLGGILAEACLIILTLSVYKAVQQWFDRTRLFKGQFSYLEKVKEQMARIRDTAYTYEGLANSLVEAVRETFPIEMAAVYFFDTEGRRLILMAQSGMKNPATEHLKRDRDALAIREDDPLIRYVTGNVSQRNLLIVREELAFGHQRREYESEAASSMAKIEAEICAPFLFGGAVKGMLILGKKESNRMFHEKDLEAIYRFSRLGEELMRYILGMEQEIRHTATYSHDMANRVKGLLRALQFVLSPFAKTSLSESVEKLLKGAQDAALGLNRSFERNTERSRLILQSVRGEYRTEPLDAAELLRGASERFILQAQEKGIHLSIHFKNPAKVEGNGEDLTRLVENLIGNALRYVPQGGHINVEGKSVNESFQVIVQDDGEGIDPANLEHIWEFGWQVKDSKSGSSGLGLSFVWEVVKAHKGKIWAESQGKGKGAKFIFVIPLLTSNSLELPSIESRKEAYG